MKKNRDQEDLMQEMYNEISKGTCEAMDPHCNNPRCDGPVDVFSAASLQRSHAATCKEGQRKKGQRAPPLGKY